MTVPMARPNMLDQLASIPPEALWNKRPKRRLALLKWCEARGFRPTFADLEAERERRRNDQHDQGDQK